jgi:DNA-binding response OmpR family regulator
MPAAKKIDGFQGIYGSLLELLQQGDRSFSTPTLEWLLERDRAVAFDQNTGRLRVGKQSLGELPIGSKEFYLMLHLSQHLDRYVSYRDLKHFIVHATGSSEETDEATFCHKLKSRIKKRIPNIDRFLVTSNKGDGYRLRALVEPG